MTSLSIISLGTNSCIFVFLCYIYLKKNPLRYFKTVLLRLKKTRLTVVYRIPLIVEKKHNIFCAIFIGLFF